MTASRPLVSIVIPCFNAGTFLGPALRSCLNQDYEPIEIIVVDDGSTDGSAELARSFAPRVKVVAMNHVGPTGARNLGYALSTGEFVQFFDADDVLSRDKISSSMRAFEEDPELDVVFMHLFTPFDYTFDEHVDIPLLPAPAHLGTTAQIYFHPEIDIPVLNTTMPLFRRRVLERHGGWDEQLYGFDDLEINFRMFVKGAKYRGLEQVGVVYRHHPSPGRVSRREHLADPSALPAMEKLVELSMDAGRVHGPLRQYFLDLFWYAAGDCLSSLHLAQARGYLDLIGRVDPAYASAGPLRTAVGLFGRWPTLAFVALPLLLTKTVQRARRRITGVIPRPARTAT